VRVWIAALGALLLALAPSARAQTRALILTVRATDPDGRVSTVYDSIG